MLNELGRLMDAVATVKAYHERTKHRLDQYAAGPGSLDWDAQPDPFRHWTGTTAVPLPRAVAAPAQPAPPTLANLSWLLRHAVALSAWKQYGPSRWSLRVHPSSGNLHPTETWVFAVGVEGLADGQYHYQPQDHSLELRANPPLAPRGTSPQGAGRNEVAVPSAARDGPKAHRGAGGEGEEPTLHLAFTTIPWREAWKYGERAFRYCQLDMGHVLAAVAYAADLLGWQPRLTPMSATDLDTRLGLDRPDDFVGVEPEHAEVMLTLFGAAAPAFAQWHGRPSLLDPKPMYQWPILDEIAQATRGSLPLPPGEGATVDSCNPAAITAATLLQRRSAQAFDGRSILPIAAFRHLLAVLLPGGSPVWRLWTYPARIHPILLVHRVEGLGPGLYCLPRSESGLTDLGQAMRATFAWTPADPELPLYRLVAAKAERTARTVSCHQDIASQCAFAVMFVAEFAQSIAANPAAWRHLHWEAGLLGHALTLAAEASGWRGTGIGCFFDDADHEILGLADDRYQVVYHFAVGMAVDDPRLTTLPAYD